MISNYKKQEFINEILEQKIMNLKKEKLRKKHINKQKMT